MDKIKTDIYYLILTYAVDETIKGNIYFEDKNIMLQVQKKLRSISKSRKMTKVQKKKTISLLQKVDKVSRDMKRLAYEMLVYIALDQLVTIEKDLTARVNFQHIPLLKILGGIEDKYTTDYYRHLDFFSEIVDNLN